MSSISRGSNNLRDALPAAILILGIPLFLVAASAERVFFWDTIQFAGKHGLWFYEQGWTAWLLPDAIDSGHPPFFGMYLALCWQWFGKSLAVSHWAMAPWLVLTMRQALLLGNHYLGPKGAWFFPLLLAIDPVWLGQAVLVSPDVVLLACFLTGWYALVRGRRTVLALAVMGLGMISLRGMIVGVALFLLALLCLERKKGRGRLQEAARALLPFLPGGMLGLAFVLVHYWIKGWVGFHPDSPWSPSFEKVTPAGLLRNLGVWGWRLLDYGRIWVWLLLGLMIWRFRRGGFRQTHSAGAMILRLATWGGLLLLLLSWSFWWYSGVNQHRYLLPFFALLDGLVLLMVFHTIPSLRWRRLTLLVLFLGLGTGNLWVYPETVAQGWDATAAHWPYDRLRKEAIRFLEEKGIALEEVGTVFPEIGPLDHRDLSGRQEGFAVRDLERQRYILYSNVMNDFSDAERATLRGAGWDIWWQKRSGGVKMIIFRKKE